MGWMLSGLAARPCLEIHIQEGGDVGIWIQHDEVGNQEGSSKEKEDLVVQPSRNAAAHVQGLREGVQGV